MYKCLTSSVLSLLLGVYSDIYLNSCLLDCLPSISGVCFLTYRRNELSSLCLKISFLDLNVACLFSKPSEMSCCLLGTVLFLGILGWKIPSLSFNYSKSKECSNIEFKPILGGFFFFSELWFFKNKNENTYIICLKFIKRSKSIWSPSHPEVAVPQQCCDEEKWWGVGRDACKVVDQGMPVWGKGILGKPFRWGRTHLGIN